MARILVIDDEEDIRELVRDMLEAEGYEVAAAASAKEGLAALEGGGADVVITDVIMPEKDGIETIIELGRRFPAVKIIAMSGGGRTRNLDFLQYARKVGAEETLAKPFTQADIIATVRRVLGPPA